MQHNFKLLALGAAALFSSPASADAYQDAALKLAFTLGVCHEYVTNSELRDFNSNFQHFGSTNPRAIEFTVARTTVYQKAVEFGDKEKPSLQRCKLELDKAIEGFIQVQ